MYPENIPRELNSSLELNPSGLRYMLYSPGYSPSDHESGQQPQEQVPSSSSPPSFPSLTCSLRLRLFKRSATCPPHFRREPTLDEDSRLSLLDQQRAAYSINDLYSLMSFSCLLLLSPGNPHAEGTTRRLSFLVSETRA